MNDIKFIFARRSVLLNFLYISLFFLIVPTSDLYGQFGDQKFIYGCHECGVPVSEPLDINGDGFLDLYVYSEAEEHLSTFINNGDNTFSANKIAEQFFAVGGGWIWGKFNLHAISDLNGDGILDFSYSFFNSTSVIEVMFGNIEGGLSSPSVIDIAEGSRFRQSADINQDGIEDLVFVNLDGTVFISIYGADGAGSYELNSSIATSYSSSNDIKELYLDDRDGDGDLDLLFIDENGVVFQSSQTDQWTFSDPQQILTAPIGSSFEDLNGDELIDLYYSTEPTTSSVLGEAGYSLSNIDGTFSEIITFTGGYANFLLATDIDEDGSNEILIEQEDSVGYLEIGTAVSISSMLALPIDIDLLQDDNSIPYLELWREDLDADGDIDYLSYNSLLHELITYTQDDTGSFNSNLIYKMPNQIIESIQGVDVNQDSKLDLALLVDFSDNSLHSELHFRLNDNTNTFSDTLNQSHLLVKRTDRMTSGDLGNDDKIDLIYSGIDSLGYGSSWYLKNEGTSFTKTTIRERNADGFYIGDLNYDGINDIGLAGSTSTSSFNDSLYYGNADGTFPTTGIAIDNLNRISSPIDFEEDGDIDFYYEDDFSIQLIENNGFGSFTDESILAITYYWHTFLLADINGDDFKDIVYFEEEIETGHIKNLFYRENIGNYEFDEPLFLSTISGSVEKIIAKDYDMDGDEDLFLVYVGSNTIGNLSNTHFGWFENEGNGVFSEFQLLSEEFMIYDSFSFIDYDGDGDEDIFFSEHDVLFGDAGSRLSYFENQSELPNITGIAYWDANANGIQDNTEVGVSGIPISIENPTRTAFTNNEGYFRFSIPAGAYNISPNINSEECWADVNPVNYEISVGDVVVDGLDFALQNNSDTKNAEGILSFQTTRCGFTIPFWAATRNTGCDREEIRLGLVLDELITDWNSDIEPMIVGDTLFWLSDTLQPREFMQQQLDITMPSADFIGSILEFKVISQIVGEDGSFTSLDEQTYLSELTCAYDPNDKAVYPSLPGYTENYTHPDGELDYTVRFQNTGNDTAFNIIIRDTLSTALDWNTFQPLDASHHYEVELNSENGALAFRFTDILLPDSIVNEPASHGYVNFKIQPNSDLNQNTEIENTAHIYFDFNPAIVTNTVTSTLSDYFLITEKNEPLCSDSNDGAIRVILPFGGVEVNYLWENGMTGAELTDIGIGDYGVVATNIEGEIIVDTIFTLTGPTSLQTAEINVLPDYAGQGNGSIEIIPAGGIVPYSYIWNTNPVQTTPIAENLSEGIYSVTVTDAAGCTHIDNATVFITSNQNVNLKPVYLHISPNPAQFSTLLSIDAETERNTMALTITNALGQIVSTFKDDEIKLENGRRGVQVENLGVGIYFAVLTEDNRVLARKKFVFN